MLASYPQIVVCNCKFQRKLLIIMIRPVLIYHSTINWCHCLQLASLPVRSLSAFIHAPFLFCVVLPYFILHATAMCECVVINGGAVMWFALHFCFAFIIFSPTNWPFLCLHRWPTALWPSPPGPNFVTSMCCSGCHWFASATTPTRSRPMESATETVTPSCCRSEDR